MTDRSAGMLRRPSYDLRCALYALPGLMLLGCLSACTPKPDTGPKPQPTRALVYPPPPDQGRFIYETDLRSRADIVIESETDMLRKLAGGGEISQENVFVKPFAVAARGGLVYITDTLGRAVHVFDAPRRRYFHFGYRFEGKLRKPLGLDIDADGRVYVTDGGLKTVVVYDAFGLFLKKIGDASELVRPTDVAVSKDGSRLYVVDIGGPESDRHRVVAYDQAGTKLFEFGGRGTEQGRFNFPVAASAGPNGLIHVLDAGNFRVQTFDLDGNFVRTWGAVGKRSGQFARPRDIATDPVGNVYVSDGMFGNVQIFTEHGRLLMSLGRVGEKDAPGKFIMLAGIGVDETSRLYAVDQIFRKVSIFAALTDGVVDAASVTNGVPVASPNQ